MKRDYSRMPTKVQCQICGERTGLDWHHIVPRGVTQCDDPENIAVLCRHHHERVEEKKLDIGLHLSPAQAAKAVLLLRTIPRAYRVLYPSEHR